METDAKVCYNYKYCIVPKCTNTTVTAPDKHYFFVPKEKKIRDLWCKVMRRKDTLSDKSVRHCCEDHFNVEEDTENFMRYKFVGGRLFLKKNILPHKFDCQKRKSDIPERSADLKRRRTEDYSQELTIEVPASVAQQEPEFIECKGFDEENELDDSISKPTDRTCVKSCVVPKCTNTTMTAPDKHYFAVPQDKQTRDKWRKVMRRKDILSYKSTSVCCEDHFNVEEDTENFMRYRFVGGRLFLKKNILPHKFDCQKRKSDITESDIEVPALDDHEENELDDSISESIDCVNVEVQTKNKSIQINTKAKKKSRQTPFRDKNVSLVGSSTTFEEIPENNYKSTLYKIKHYTQLYLGLSQDTYFLIETLVNNVEQPQMHLLITLKKIRLNDSYSRLAVDFNLQEGSIAKLIRKTLPLLAHFMKELIYFPEQSVVEDNLPMEFRTRFSKTQSIIDCFEIQIQQPSYAIHQSLTWSSHKGCNTLKYLISITPNGFINFISSGYGGRVDDAVLFQDCNLIDKIPTGSTILADREFTHIDSIVESKGCKLIRPSSVKTGTVSDKADVMETKGISDVLIHVERTIERLQSFKMLAPHASVNVKMLPVFDDIVIVACGLVNLQSVLTKQ